MSRYKLAYHKEDPSWFQSLVRIRRGRKSAGWYFHHRLSGRVVRFEKDYGRFDSIAEAMEALGRYNGGCGND